MGRVSRPDRDVTVSWSEATRGEMAMARPSIDTVSSNLASVVRTYILRRL